MFITENWYISYELLISTTLNDISWSSLARNDCVFITLEHDIMTYENYILWYSYETRS